jgi:hypothetical protein
MYCPDMPLEPPAPTAEQEIVNDMIYAYIQNKKTPYGHKIKNQLENMGYYP